MGSRAFLATCLSLLLVYVPVAPAASPAVVGKISTKGNAAVNGVPVPEEATIFAGDRITTEKETASGVSLPGGDQVFLPSLTTAQLSRSGDQVTVALERGALAVVNRSAQPVAVEAAGVRIRAANPPGGVYEVAVDGAGLKVMVRKGTALVKASNRTVEVKEGTTLDATVAPGPMGTGGMTPLLTGVMVTSVAAGVTGLALGVKAVLRPTPQNCVVVSPSAITCP
jgi:hypothetical protein